MLSSWMGKNMGILHDRCADGCWGSESVRDISNGNVWQVHEHITGSFRIMEYRHMEYGGAWRKDELEVWEVLNPLERQTGREHCGEAKGEKCGWAL